MRRLEFVRDGSAKFWEGERNGAIVTLHWGRIDTNGQTQHKEFADAGKAEAFLTKQIAEKQRKGYAPVAEAGTTSPAEPPRSAPAPVEPDGAVPGPDEDTFVLSAGVARQTYPRRDIDPPKNGVKRDAQQKAAEFLATHQARLEEILDNEDNEPEIVDATRRFLKGTPDALGAAATAIGIAMTLRWSSTDHAVLGPGWVAAHGVVFAARAAVTLADLEWNGHGSWPPPRRLRFHRRDGRAFGHWAGTPILPPVRSALAAVSAENYAAAVEALAPLRDTPRHRAIAAFLVPTETAWVDEASTEVDGTDRGAGLLLSAVRNHEQLDRFAASVYPWVLEDSPRILPTLLRALGPTLAPTLAGWLTQANPELTRRLLRLLAEIPTDEAFGLLLDRLGQKHVEPVVLEAMKRYPRRALRMLASRTAESTIAASLLRTLLQVHPELAEITQPTLPEEFHQIVQDSVSTTDRLPEAPKEQLPDVVVTPPWTRPHRAMKPVVLTELTVPEECELSWLPGEQQEWAAVASQFQHWNRADKSWPQLLDDVLNGVRPYLAENALLSAPPELALPVLAQWRPGRQNFGEESWGRALLGRFGLAAVPAVLFKILGNPRPSTIPVLIPVRNAEVAKAMTGMFARRKALRGVTISWFARHGTAAVPPLVPAALGKPGDERTDAELALRFLAERFGKAEVLDAVTVHGEKAVDAVRTILDRDPLDVLPTRMPKIPGWLDLALLPQVRMAEGGNALPLDAVGHLVTMLAIGKPGAAYAGVELVMEACDRASLTEFAWGLFERWQAAGFPAKDGWVLTALGVLGSDETVRRLTPLVRKWPGEGWHQRAVAALDVLAEIGTDVALIHLHSIAQKIKFAGLREKAQEKIEQIAADLNLSAEQLADRLVPDLGLEKDGSLVLDYGPRRFTVGFTEELKPYVSDEDGRPRKTLPKPGAKDDPNLAPEAHKRFSALKKDARTVAADLIDRLERAMVTQRRWPATEFNDLFVAHPLSWHAARRLVWAVYDGAGEVTATFRLAEDRTFTDATGETFTLPIEAVVGVPHPLHLGDTLPVWSEVFADDEILQPFPQLARAGRRLTDQERAGTRLPLFEGAEVPVGKILGLTRRGWQRGTPQDSGLEWSITKPLPDGRVIVVDLDPGILVVNVEGLGDHQRIDRIFLTDDPYGSSRSTQPFSSLDVVTEAELVADLTEVLAP